MLIKVKQYKELYHERTEYKKQMGIYSALQYFSRFEDTVGYLGTVGVGLMVYLHIGAVCHFRSRQYSVVADEKKQKYLFQDTRDTGHLAFGIHLSSICSAFLKRFLPIGKPREIEVHVNASGKRYRTFEIKLSNLSSEVV